MGAEAVITGVSETECSGYGSCGDAFVTSLNNAVELGMDYELRIETPLMRWNEAGTWALADHYNQFGVNTPSHTDLLQRHHGQRMLAL